VGGSVALLGVLSVLLVVVLFVVFRAPAPEPNQVVQNQPEGFVEGVGGIFVAPGDPLLPGADIGAPPPVVNFDPAKKPAAAGQLNAATLKKVKKSTAYLRVTMTSGAQAEGSGFFAVEPGIVVTNAHVLGMLQSYSPTPTNVDVVINGGEADEMTLRGTVIAVDRSNDLAILRVPANGLPPPLAVHSAAELVELQNIYIFGFPFGKKLGSNITVTEGAISSIRKDAFGSVTQVQLNGDMQPGNSGGPVVDADGRVIGVSVAIIKGTRINFAVPADSVKAILDGRLAEKTFGEPYLDNNQAKLPVKFKCLDPLDRVRSFRVEIWAGNNGPLRPTSTQQPAASPGDGPKQSFKMSYQNGTAVGDIPLPEAQPGQVFWVQAIFVDGAGATRWVPMPPLTPSAVPPLQRTAATLQMKVDQPGERTVVMKNSKSLTVYEGKNMFSEGLNFEANLLETLTPNNRGTGLRVTIGANQFHDDFGGKAIPIDANYSGQLRSFSPNFLMDSTGKLRERGDPRFNAALPPQDRETLETMYNRICSAFEETCLYMPNRAVQPLENWPAKVPTMVGKGNKKKVLDIDLTCTYQGSRVNNGRNEAFISLAGSIRGRDKIDKDAMGRVNGRAILDLDGGYLSQVVMELSSEVDFGHQAQMVLSEKISLTRTPGNPHNIKQAAGPVGKQPAVAGGKALFGPITLQLTATDAFDPQRPGCRAKTHPFKFEAGKTYVIDMKQPPGSNLDPFLRLLDPAGRQIAFDDDSGGGIEAHDAQIIFRAPQSGDYRTIATTFGRMQTGAYILTITLRD
jgi:S1-C subfamily serine protease